MEVLAVAAAVLIVLVLAAPLQKYGAAGLAPLFLVGLPLLLLALPVVALLVARLVFGVDLLD
jgi:hypothetical protein